MRTIFFPRELIHTRRDGMVFCVICCHICVRGNKCTCCRVPRMEEEMPLTAVPVAA